MVPSRWFLILLAISALSCVSSSTKATFYPIEGPFSKQSPLPIITATADGITGATGDISLTLPDGEVCTGRWSIIAPRTVKYSTGSASGVAASGMSSAWASAYGSGVSVANQPGVNRGEAMLVGNRGTVISLEFFAGSGTANGVGVATDNKGNIYKVLF